MINDQFPGIYFTYTQNKFQAFRNTHISHNIIIYIPGLEAHLLSDPLSIFLYNFCNTSNYTFCQPIFRSHPHYGLFTLKDDHTELQNLILIYQKCNIILVGSSTGCMNIMYLAKHTTRHNAILVAPVSDREYQQSISTIIEEKNLKDIFIMEGNVVMKRERYLDLFVKNGKDDMFSSDLGIEHFRNLNPMMWNLVFVVCGKDEYVVKSNKWLLEHVGGACVVEIGNADHFLTDERDIEEFKDILEKLILEVFDIK